MAIKPPEDATSTPAQGLDAVVMARPAQGYRLTSDFGTRNLSFSSTYNSTASIASSKTRLFTFHVGNDYATPVGTPLEANVSGKVIAAGNARGAGNYITVDAGHGVAISFLHLSKIDVRYGQTVNAGDIIGKTGNTGHGTGAHLDARVSIDGVFVDPEKVWGKDLTDPQIRQALVDDSLAIAQAAGKERKVMISGTRIGAAKSEHEEPVLLAQADTGTTTDASPALMAAPLTTGNQESEDVRLRPGQIGESASYRDEAHTAPTLQTRIDEADGKTQTERDIKRIMRDEQYRGAMDQNPLMFFLALLFQMFGERGQGNVLAAFQSESLNKIVTASTGIQNPRAIVDSAATIHNTHNSDEWRSFIDHLIKREDSKNVVYKDSEGHLTVGVGHLVKPSDNLKFGDRISDEQIMKFLEKDAKDAFDAAKKQAAEMGVNDKDIVVGLASVNYQLGAGWTKDFNETWPAIKAGNYTQAIANLERSKWNAQTPVRVDDFQSVLARAEKIRNGTITAIPLGTTGEPPVVLATAGGLTQTHATTMASGGKAENTPAQVTAAPSEQTALTAAMNGASGESDPIQQTVQDTTGSPQGQPPRVDIAVATQAPAQAAPAS